MRERKWPNDTNKIVRSNTHKRRRVKIQVTRDSSTIFSRATFLSRFRAIYINCLNDFVFEVAQKSPPLTVTRQNNKSKGSECPLNQYKSPTVGGISSQHGIWNDLRVLNHLTPLCRQTGANCPCATKTNNTLAFDNDFKRAAILPRAIKEEMQFNNKARLLLQRRNLRNLWSWSFVNDPRKC